MSADINNNQPKTTKPTTTTTTSPATKPQTKTVDLKQASMSASIVVIDKEALAGSTLAKKPVQTARTESNQSSSESLQDVEGEEGFVTITSKKSTKKTAVRRET